jgi:hypothetical protein
MTWQYNGVDHWYKIMEWCETNIRGGYTTNLRDTIYFVNKKDYTLFLLRWV